MAERFQALVEQTRLLCGWVVRTKANCDQSRFYKKWAKKEGNLLESFKLHVEFSHCKPVFSLFYHLTTMKLYEQ